MSSDTVQDFKEYLAGMTTLPRWDWVVKFHSVAVLGRLPDGSARTTLDQGIQNVLNEWEQQGIELVQLVPTVIGDYIFIGRKIRMVPEPEPEPTTPPVNQQSSPQPQPPKEAESRSDGGKTSGKSPRRR